MTPKTSEAIEARCLSLATVEKFELGYCNDDPRKGIYDRLVFPVRNQYGEYVAFTARALFDFEKQNMGKWWHSPDPEQTWKRFVLYGLYENFRTILELDYVVIVEGPFDVLALYECGIPAVAILGINPSREQMLILRRYTKNVLLWLDNDKAGGVGLTNIEKHAKDLGMKLSVVKSQIKDASDVLRYKGKGKVRHAVHTSTS